MAAPAGASADAPALSAPPRWLFVAGLALIGSYAASTLGYVLTIRPAGVVFLWPPSGLMLGALLVTRKRHWSPMLAGAFLGNALTDYAHGASPLLAIAGSAVNSLEQFAAAFVARRMAGRHVHPTSLRSLGAFLLGAVTLSNAATALLGGVVLSAYSRLPYWRGWFNWWTGDGIGMLILTPLVITTVVALRERKFPSRERVAEGVGFIGAVGLVAAVLLANSRSGGETIEGHAFLVYPLLITAGLRLGPWGAAAASVTLAGVTAAFAMAGRLGIGVTATEAPAQVLEVYTYLALAAISALIPAAVVFDRDATANELRRSEFRFRQIAENINEAFFVVDLTTYKTTYVSPSWATIWGRPLEEGYDSRIWLNAIHPDDRAAVERDQAANARGEPTVTEFRITRPDGSLRTLRGRAFPVRDPVTATVVRVVGLAEDVTGMKDTERRFVQSQKMEAVGRLSSGVAHDFNNLLTVIFAETEMLSTTSLSAEARDSVKEIQHAAESAAGLTRQLLTFSRRQITEPSVFDINAVVMETSKMLHRLIGEDVTLELRLDTQKLGVLADRGQIEQVLTNLVVNARDAMPRGGLIRLETSHAFAARGVDADAGAAPRRPSPSGASWLGWVSLTVRDTGTGMSPEVMAHAFEPFFTTKDLGRGTGLGLATCHGIVTQAGGRISIESNPGAGTTIHVLLPEAEIAESSESRARDLPSLGGKERVLLVEDETGVRKATARLLRARGYEVLEARDGPDALRLLADERGQVDLLLTDVVLPGMSGRELSEKVHDVIPAMKTLFASGYVGEAAMVEEGDANEEMIIAKPFTAAQLANRVREALDARKTES
jgi:PAS domain S-box-containing protein